MKIKTWVDKNFDKNKDFVLITGASSGIGESYLRLFAELGCNAIVVSNEVAKQNKVAHEVISRFGVQVISVECDLSKQDEIVELLKRLESFNIKVLINNAGFGIKGDFLETSQEKYRDIIGVNVLAPTLLTYGLLKRMKEQNLGLIITVASINVISPIPKNTVYTATKSYLYHFSLALAKENQDTNIVFQTLLPGTTKTPFHDKQGVSPQSMTMLPQDVAEHSLANIGQLVCIPNRMDRVLSFISPLIPVKVRMELSSFFLKKRLGV